MKQKDIFKKLIESIDNNNLFKEVDYAIINLLLKKIIARDKNYVFFSDFNSSVNIGVIRSISKSIKKFDKSISKIDKEMLEEIVANIEAIKLLSQRISELSEEHKSVG